MSANALLTELGVSFGPLRRCEQCLTAARLSDRFCSQCGVRLRALLHHHTGDQTPDFSGSTSGERRQVTVMFCDLVGSTALTSQNDPEEARRVMQLYQATCANVVIGYGGHIAQTLGDGLLVYFGYPHAHEDDAERAVHAGLEIVSKVSDARGSLRRVWHACAVRVGISTGVVVVGAFSQWDTRAAMAVVGETPNVAARLQHLAGRNEVVIGPETAHLVEGHFDLESMGKLPIAGIEEPMSVWRVRERRSLSTRFLARQQQRPADMVGRDRELTQLVQCWQRACAGEAQTAILSGPAGIGKSRLAHALSAVAQRDRCVQLRVQCSPYFSNTALHPVVFQLRRAAAIRSTDSTVTKLAKLKRTLRDESPLAPESFALLARLLQLPVPNEVLDSGRGPERVLDDTVEVLISSVARLAARRPVLVLLEDAHWMDPTTLKLLQRLMRRCASQRLMLLVTDRGRPANCNYGPAETCTTIELEGLPRSASLTVVRRVAGPITIPDSMAERIVHRSDGLPLYVEELTKVLLDGSHQASAGAVPSTLSALLTERIDRVGPLKLIAQVGACIGRAFDRGLLCRLFGLDPDALDTALQQLVTAGLLTCDSEGGDRNFVFRHALLQGAAYDSMLREERRQVHAAIAEILQHEYPEICEHEPETVARHLTAARDRRRACYYWLRAAELAQRRSAHVEAIAHLQAGLACIQERQASMQAEEIEFQSALARSHMAAEGWPGVRVGRAYERARSLARELGDKHRECVASWGLWANRATKGQLNEALIINTEALTTAQAQSDRSSLLMAHTAALMTHCWLGQFKLAEQHAEQIDRNYSTSEDRELAQAYNHDPLTMASSYRSSYYWIQGMPTRARRWGAACMDHVRQLEHSFHLCLTLFHCSGAFWRSDASACALVDEGLALAKRERIPLFRFYGPLHAASALVRRDPTEATLKWLHSCLDHVRTKAGPLAVNLPFFALNVARGHAHLGQWRAADELLREAASCIAGSGERWLEPELSRARGHLMLHGYADSDAAEHELRHGLQLAHSMGSGGLALALACDLTDLLNARARCEEAALLLTETCSAWPLEPGDELHDRARGLLRSLPGARAAANTG